MSFFDRFRRDRGQPLGGESSPRATEELEEFMRNREGVEAFVEPPTSVYAMSLCLVAADGDYVRRPVKNEIQARKLCADHGVPMYDARIVGYPRRMRDFQRGNRQRKVSLDDLPPLEVTDDPRRQFDD